MAELSEQQERQVPKLTKDQAHQFARQHLTTEEWRIYEMKYIGDSKRGMMNSKEIAKALGKEVKGSAVLMALYRIRLKLQKARDTLPFAKIEIVDVRPTEEQMRPDFEIPIKRGHEPYDVLDVTAMKAFYGDHDREAA